uniref:Uncharacterized protein n=1 Tax=Peronospora matthiolae TaxID=2874970 RepID=A0AAV1TQF6_9STRA
MLIFRLQDSQYYGVQHGSLFYEWHARLGPATRTRLDTAHRAVGLPVLDASAYDPDSLAEIVRAEEVAILEDMGLDIYSRFLRRRPWTIFRLRIEFLLNGYTQTHGQIFSIAAQEPGNGTWADYFPWFAKHKEALRYVMAVLPFPELAAQQIPIEQLMEWGAVEAYRQQITSLRRVADDEESDDRARTHCRDWLSSCESASPQEAQMLAKSDSSWE